MTTKEIKLLAKEIVDEQMRYCVVGIEEAADILGVKPATIQKRLKSIPHGKFGNGKPRFRKSDLIKLLER